MTDPTDKSIPPATITIVIPKARDAHDGRLARHEFEIGRAEELGTDEKAEKDRDERKTREHAGILKPGLVHLSASRREGRIAAGLAPDASRTNACSVHSDAGRGSPSRPRDMTAMRSHSARSSGKYELTMRTAFCGRPDTNSPINL